MSTSVSVFLLFKSFVNIIPQRSELFVYLFYSIFIKVMHSILLVINKSNGLADNELKYNFMCANTFIVKVHLILL